MSLTMISSFSGHWFFRRVCKISRAAETGRVIGQSVSNRAIFRQALSQTGSWNPMLGRNFFPYLPIIIRGVKFQPNVSHPKSFIAQTMNSKLADPHKLSLSPLWDFLTWFSRTVGWASKKPARSFGGIESSVSVICVLDRKLRASTRFFPHVFFWVQQAPLISKRSLARDLIRMERMYCRHMYICILLP